MRNEQPRPTSPSSTSRSVELLTDAIITAYIHEISPRHRRPDASGELMGAPAQTA